MYRFIIRRRQCGSVVVTVSFVLLFLLGFMGIALDLGRLFIVKTELQTAMDSCALAAAQELDGRSDALTRAADAGIAAGNLNRVDLQSATWRDRGQITSADITFKDAAYAEVTDPATARYAQCRHVQSGVRMWLLHAMGAFSGDSATYPNTRNVLALAVATRSSAQTACPIPVALRPNGPAPNYGLTVGDWVTLIMDQNAAQGGEIGWANLDGSNNASQTEEELEGSCGTRVGDTLGTPGVQTSVADVWNYRFGIYRNGGDPSINRPDFTGYAYTAKNWPSERNAYDGDHDGDPSTPEHPTARNFITKRLAFASCADTGSSVDDCESIIGRRLNGFQRLATPGEHMQYGYNRRLVTVPVIDDQNQVIDYACMLMLQPLSVPMRDVQLEFRGNSSAPNSPCPVSGLPGGTGGPLVPVLVE